jgi:hypothetical protein
MAKYRRDVIELAKLPDRASESTAGPELVASVRGMISRLFVNTAPNEQGLQADLRGFLATLCGLESLGMSDVSRLPPAAANRQGD